MRHFEVSFIVDPVLSGDEVQSTAKAYCDMLSAEGAKIVHIDEMGLRQLAYPLNKRNTGLYYCVEFATESPTMIAKVELAMKRDDRILRFLTVKLDKYGIKYNEDKRAGKIGRKNRKEKPVEVVSRPAAAVPPPPPPPPVVVPEIAASEEE